MSTPIPIERNSAFNHLEAHADSRISKLKLILEKMENVIRTSQLAFNQKRIHREYKAVAALDKLLEIQCTKHNEINTFSPNRTEEDNKSRLILPDNDGEYDEVIRYLTYELNELAIQEDYSSGLSDSSISYRIDHRSKVKVFSSKQSNKYKSEDKSKGRQSDKRKQIVNKENIKKYFYDIEYKIKMELRKYEIDQKIRSKCESLTNTGEIKLTCFTTSRDASNKRNAISPCVKSKIQFDHIKNFFVEDRATAAGAYDKKRYSMLSSKLPEIEDLTLNDTILESGQNSEEENSDQEDYPKVLIAKNSFFNSTNTCFKTSKLNTKRRNTLQIGSSLFD